MSDDVEFSEVGELETVESQIQEQEAQAEDKDELPDRYRGKTPAEIAKMHQEAEKALSRQGQELGQVRKLAEELIQKELTQKQQADKAPLKEVDFFENPQEAIRQAVETNPAVLQAQQLALQARQEQAKAKLMQKHPDFAQVVADPDFAQWVGSSPVRQNLLRQADSYDVDAADELLTVYKELKSVKVAKVNAEDSAQRKKALNSAGVDTGGSGESTKKVYRREDIIRLRMKDPAKYDAMSAEITRAYAEGRVR